MRVARIYLRVSTAEQDLTRQEVLIAEAKAAGFYVAAVYREKASGAHANRPELLRMINDLQPGEVLIAESIDRISRLPLAEAEQLIFTIRDKGARLSIPGIVDLSELAAEHEGIPKIVLESVQEMLLKVALQVARDDYLSRRERQRQGIIEALKEERYKGRAPNLELHERIIEKRLLGKSITKTAKELNCALATVKRVWALHKRRGAQGTTEALSS
ncbi:recombinase family protein (plasmid) [Pseudoduganella sp. UC29_106]|uniref:recombinase family protein n=1 Tax=Pseudoduganella sp. UC29_106 TaxID=3374553 RepID=UPI0037569F88